MEDAAVGVCQVADPAQSIVRTTVRKPATLVLCSQVNGRERWYVDALENSPRLAATVELVLQSEKGITEVRANPLTGRVLVCYDRHLLAETVETLIERALGFGPMSRGEFSLLRSRPSGLGSLRSLIATELGCSALRMIVLGGVCPAGLAAAALFFFLRRVSPAAQCAHAA
ncbi:MAG: Lipid export ATP-binding/permease protein MsbA [Candidatus Solibacter sp.]|nr:Lipid export ATP-binding/permease protein MsbA [Candidatus Solibacter sp.]